MNWYHTENPPLPTDSNSDTNSNSNSHSSNNDSKRGKAHAENGRWYPWKLKLNPPSHKHATPPTIVANVPQKKRKLDDISTDAIPTTPNLTYTFRVRIIDPQSYPAEYLRSDNIFVHCSANRWHLSQVENPTTKTLQRAVSRLCPARDVNYILGCLVMPDSTSLRPCDATRLNSNDSVAVTVVSSEDRRKSVDR
ncbi:hypothetical protein BDD12DRAFT_807871 [Trichophaea hybrida]|nr:hypothetical protein BDD12DRAFT_807871 [Trichophaea hybrida]